MNSFEEEVELAVKALSAGKTILYPTDTIWGIGCDPTNAKAINRIYTIKKRVDNRNLIILVDHIERLKDYVTEVPDVVYDLIRAAEKPLTIVYSSARNLAKNLLPHDKSIAIRVTSDPFCQAMIVRFGKAVVSTSANISGEPAALTFAQITEPIRQSVDHIVGLYQQQVRQPKASTIIRMKTSGEFTIIRP
jgi:L-threonylcarbamoyladenylate synthase